MNIKDKINSSDILISIDDKNEIRLQIDPKKNLTDFIAEANAGHNMI